MNEQIEQFKQQRGAQPTGLLISKQADGQYRYFGWVSNHFRDNDTPREIISGEAHKEFVEYLDKTGNYPVLEYWHIHGSKMGKADWAEFADGFFMLSGMFDKGMSDVAERIANAPEEYAMSHGFVRLKHDAAAVVTDRYRMIEHSILPRGREANPWTSFLTMEDKMPISPHKKAKLVELMGEERVTAIEAGTLDKAQAAKDAGVDFKEIESLEPLDAPTDPPPVTETKETPPTETDKPINVKELAAALIAELQLDSLSEMVTQLKEKTDTIAALTEKMVALEAVVKGLKESDDKKIAATIAPKATKSLAWFKEGFVASGDESTKLKDNDPDDQKLKASAPSKLDKFLTQLG